MTVSFLYGWIAAGLRSPIAKSGRSGNTTDIIALSRVLGNPGWTDDMFQFQIFMGDTNQNHFQTQQTHGIANEAVVEQVDAENTASHVRNHNIHIMNKGKWTNEETSKLGQINREERQKGKNFMKRIK